MVGELAGVSASAISQAERGHRGLSFTTLLELTDRLGTTIEQLLSPCRGESGYRVGRRRVVAGDRPTLDRLIAPDHDGRTVSVVHLPAGRSLLSEPESRACAVLIVAEGIVEVTTSFARTVLRSGDVMTTTPADDAVTGLRDLGPGSTVFLVEWPDRTRPAPTGR